MTMLVVAVVAIVLGEAAGLAGFGLARVLLDATLVLVLLLRAGQSRGAVIDRLLLVLVLLPLTRLLGLVLAGLQWPLAATTAAVGVPVLAAAVLAVRHLRLAPVTLGLPLREPALQLVIALSGLPLGLAGYALLRPPAAYAAASFAGSLLNLAAVVVFSAVLEELVFRVLLQSQAVAALDVPLGLALTAGLYATLYLGTGDWRFALFMGAVGLYFSYCVLKTQSVWGVVAAHALLVAVLLLVLPPVMSAAP